MVMNLLLCLFAFLTPPLADIFVPPGTRVGNQQLTD